MSIWFIVAGLIALLVLLSYFPMTEARKEDGDTPSGGDSEMTILLSRRARRRQRKKQQAIGRTAIRPLPKIAYTDPASYAASLPDNYQEEEVYADDADDYDLFVANTWSRATIHTDTVTIEINGEPCNLISLTPGPHGYPYVNVRTSEGSRKSYAADSRHSWSVYGIPVKPDAFLAMMHGVNPITALHDDDAPETYEESLRMDRIDDGEKRYAIHYENAEGERAWRVVSRVVRDFESFTARCHLRWGARRTFRWDRLLEVIDLKTGEIIPLASFQKSRSSRK